MKKIAVYKYKDTPDNQERECVGEISRVQLLPENIEEMKSKIEKYNSDQDTYIVISVEIEDVLFDVVEYLLKDRRLDINRHIDVLEDIKSQLSDMDDYLYSSIREIKSDIEKKNIKH